MLANQMGQIFYSWKRELGNICRPTIAHPIGARAHVPAAIKLLSAARCRADLPGLD